METFIAASSDKQTHSYNKEYSNHHLLVIKSLKNLKACKNNAASQYCQGFLVG